MVHIVINYTKIIILFFFTINVYAQQLNRIESNYKPLGQNSPFYFKNNSDKNYSHCYYYLGDFLSQNVPIPDNINCKHDIEIFVFKVNLKGKIVLLKSFGFVDTLIREKVKENILATEGHWILPNNKSKFKDHWFIVPFHSFGINNNDCVNKESLKALVNYEILFEELMKNIRNLLPRVENITVLNGLTHYWEMEKRGMIIHDQM